MCVDVAVSMRVSCRRLYPLRTRNLSLGMAVLLDIELRLLLAVDVAESWRSSVGLLLGAIADLVHPFVCLVLVSTHQALKRVE